MKIEIREYQRKDAKALENVIREAWCYDRFCSPKTASRLARVFLSSCLANQTFSRVAVVDGIPVGIILGKDIAAHRCPFSYRIKQIGAILSLYLSKEGRKTAKIFEDVHGIDQQLLKECGKEYPAELALFAVASLYRGKGIGKRLFACVLDYFKEQKLKEFYLYTDTSCNYGFYEHHGMIRRCERNHSISLEGQTQDMKFFIYEYPSVLEN